MSLRIVLVLSLSKCYCVVLHLGRRIFNALKINFIILIYASTLWVAPLFRSAFVLNLSQKFADKFEAAVCVRPLLFQHTQFPSLAQKRLTGFVVDLSSQGAGYALTLVLIWSVWKRKINRRNGLGLDLEQYPRRRRCNRVIRFTDFQNSFGRPAHLSVQRADTWQMRRLRLQDTRMACHYSTNTMKTSQMKEKKTEIAEFTPPPHPSAHRWRNTWLLLRLLAASVQILV